MALVKGTNSYVTVAEANTFFADRLDVAAWLAADDASKAQALVTATSVLDDQRWIGTAIGESQPLAFPRSAYYFDPRLGTQIMLDQSVVPDRIVTATMHLAHHLLTNDGLLDDTGQVQDLQVGSVSLTNVTAPSLIPGVVRRLIKPLLVNSGSHGWWRAN